MEGSVKVKHGVEIVPDDEVVAIKTENGAELVVITRQEYDRLKTAAGKPATGAVTPAMGVGTPVTEAGKPATGSGTPATGVGTPATEAGKPATGDPAESPTT